ncbi:MAG: dihydrofolate reductase [Actinobacteria bacterium]|nr:MAG: dihydrofolate reductase [Actinomycetota bacterium]
MASDVVAYVAVSLDGFIAESDGSVAFLDDFGSDEYKFHDFIDGVGALVMGSATYEQVVGFGWPYGEIPALVLTSRDLPVAEGATIDFSSERTGEAIRSYSSVTEKRVWVVGGGKVVTAALQSGAIDTLELYLMPVALGRGVPLFTEPCEGPLTLVESQAFSNGVVKLLDTTAVEKAG